MREANRKKEISNAPQSGRIAFDSRVNGPGTSVLERGSERKGVQRLSRSRRLRAGGLEGKAPSIVLIILVLSAAIGPGLPVKASYYEGKSAYHPIVGTYLVNVTQSADDAFYINEYDQFHSNTDDIYLETLSYTSRAAFLFRGYNIPSDEYVQLAKFKWRISNQSQGVGVNDQKIRVSILTGSEVFAINEQNLEDFDYNNYTHFNVDGSYFGNPTGVTNGRFDGSFSTGWHYTPVNEKFGYGYTGDVLVILESKVLDKYMAIRSYDSSDYSPSFEIKTSNGHLPASQETAIQLFEANGYEIWKVPAAEGEKDEDFLLPAMYDGGFEIWEFNTSMAANVSGAVDVFDTIDVPGYFQVYGGQPQTRGYLYNETHMYMIGAQGTGVSDNTYLVRATRPNVSAPFDTFTTMCTLDPNKKSEVEMLPDIDNPDIIHIAMLDSSNLDYENYTISTNTESVVTSVHTGNAASTPTSMLMRQDNDGGLHIQYEHGDATASRLESRYAYRANGTTTWSKTDHTSGVLSTSSMLYLDETRDRTIIGYSLSGGRPQYRTASPIGNTTFSAAADLADQVGTYQYSIPQEYNGTIYFWFNRQTGTYYDIAYASMDNTTGTISYTNTWYNSGSYHHTQPFWFEYGQYTAWFFMGHALNSFRYFTDASAYNIDQFRVGTAVGTYAGDDNFSGTNGRAMHYVVQNPEKFALATTEAYLVYDEQGNLVGTATTEAAAHDILEAAVQAAFDAYWTEETYLGYFGLGGLLAACVIPALILQRLKEGDIPTAFALLIVEACCIALMVGWLSP